MKLKFCGIRRREDVIYCNVLQPDYMGMILSPGFRRSVTMAAAAALVKEKHASIAAVGVFVNASAEEIARVLRSVSLDVIQLHGAEDAGTIAKLREMTGLPIWKAVRVQSEKEIRQAEYLGADQFVLEGHVPGQVGGTGQIANWELIAKAAPRMPYFLAGGLKPENIQAALKTLQPTGIDLSSGIETDGVKDYEKMKEIVKIIRGEYHG
ncbi:phosphoribosylanthranilate isomerase [Ruminococcus sp.]|uniref:phosphoribosylanthranilate isomerase n=1 Tax=Ruminococcus sp. TaxID=41978 RepID=UPI0025D8CAC2|nr:phosphoribosylanthranilate isomerase [Ruminococcus sp.]